MHLKLYLVLLLVLIVILPGCGKKEVKPNILLITIDTLRQDYVGCYGFSLDTTPFIDELAKKGMVFKKVVTPIPLTAGSHASILTSLHPLTHQVIANGSELNGNVETIAEVLKKNGYYTVAATAVRHLSARFNFSQGFDSFSDSWDENEFKYNAISHRVAASVNKSVTGQIDRYLRKYKNREKPLFMWVHYFDPHFPYAYRKYYDFKHRRIKKSKINYLYAGEILYTDKRIKELYRYLEQNGLTEPMITCITADHGEQHGEHGFKNKHVDFYSETTFVPLVFHGYKVPVNKTVDRCVSTMDIAKTLLGLVNLEFETPVNGLDLLDSKDRGRPQPPSGRNRDFLVIGDPDKVRSIQWIGSSSAYILNLDFLYEWWYLSPGTDFPESSLKPVPKKAVDIEYNKKKDRVLTSIKYPYTLREGLHYGVLRFDIKKNNGFYLGHIIHPARKRATHRFDQKTTGTVTAYYPITPLDHLICYIGKESETEIVNFRYAVITEREFLECASSRIQLKNKFFSSLRTERQFKPGDQLFNMETDFKMETNLLENGGHTREVIGAKKSIYNYLRFYWNEKTKLLGKSVRSKPLSKKEKDILKSLGYL